MIKTKTKVKYHSVKYNPENLGVFYLPCHNLYIDNRTGESYDEDQMTWFNQQKQEWRKSQRVPSFFELINTFGPECYPAAKRAITLTIDQAKDQIKITKIAVDNFYSVVINPAPYEKQKGLIETMRGLYDHHLDTAEHIIHQGNYRLSFLRRLQTRYLATRRGTTLPPEDPHHITEIDIKQAKTVPIETLYQGQFHPHKRGGRITGICPFHSERTSSFTIYPELNTWHCFGCHAGRDAIDFVMKRENIEFLAAVKFLLNRT